jgi:hypothetical protein
MVNHRQAILLAPRGFLEIRVSSPKTRTALRLASGSPRLQAWENTLKRKRLQALWIIASAAKAAID